MGRSPAALAALLAVLGAALIAGCGVPALPTDPSPPVSSAPPSVIPAVSAPVVTSASPGASPEPAVSVSLPPSPGPRVGSKPLTLPAASGGVDTSAPDKVIGDGTPASCTSAALAEAVKSGGVITFNCGTAPHTIVVEQTLYTCNTDTCAHPWQGGTPVARMVLDGGGLITLSGGGARGIFYANTCEESFGWLSASCQNETTPKVVFQNLGFVDGNASAGPAGFDGVGGGGGGGAIAMRGGQLVVVNSVFTRNVCMAMSSDGGGGAIRVTGMVAPVSIVNSRIEGNSCANGGGISSLGATVIVQGSVIANNTATGMGANSGQGGNGGGIYCDGTSNSIVVEGSTITGNVAPEGGPGIFYVSNDQTGTLSISNSQITGNSGQSFFTDPYRSIFYIGKGDIQVSNSTVE